VQIQILAVTQVTKQNKNGKPMQVLEVAYKNLTFNNKVESKQLFDFGVQADTFKTLATARGADVYDVEVVKNNAGYNDWVKVTKGSAATSGTGSPTGHSSATNPPTTKGGWETPEERAKKQIYIVRQSSVSAAINLLSAHAKTTPKLEDVIDTARRFEAYVFESDAAETVARKDVGSIETMGEDIPY
jgi:hypothetical protein